MKKLTLIFLLLCSYNLFAHMSSSDQDELTKKTIHFFNALRADNTEILDDFYAKNIKFFDPVGKVESLPEMKAYYKNMYKGVESSRFDFKNIANSSAIYFFSWDMYLKTPKLNAGEEFVVTGVSEIHFDEDGLAVFHRDYFDLGEMVYERIPVVGWLVKKIKKRLEH